MKTSHHVLLIAKPLRLSQLFKDTFKTLIHHMPGISKLIWFLLVIKHGWMASRPCKRPRSVISLFGNHENAESLLFNIYALEPWILQVGLLSGMFNILFRVHRFQFPTTAPHMQSRSMT